MKVGLRRVGGRGREPGEATVIPPTSGAREGTEGSSIPRGSKHA